MISVGAALMSAAFSSNAGVFYEKVNSLKSDGYIVVLNSDGISKKDRIENLPKTAADLSSRYKATPFSESYGGAFDWFSVKMDHENAKIMSKDPRIKYIQPNYIFQSGARQYNPPWGLDYLDSISLNSLFSYPTDPAQDGHPYIYVIDSGITNHGDFGGRVVKTKDYIPADTVIDPHGTHVAGIIGGTKSGVAKNSKLVSVRVLDGNGLTTATRNNLAIQWVMDEVLGKSPIEPITPPPIKAIINISIEKTGIDILTNDLISKALQHGIITVAIAGNGRWENGQLIPFDACAVNSSGHMWVPKDAVKVGAIDWNMTRKYNWGSCLDFYAPGVNILSAKAHTANEFIEYSGTSMAAPHVAGALSLLRSKYPSLSAEETINLLKSQSRNSGRIGEHNVPVLYTGFLGEYDTPPPPPPPPPTPTGLQAISLSCWGQSVVYWQSSAGATRYELFHNTQRVSSNAYSGMETTVYNTTTNLRVKACNGTGCSSESSPVLAPYVRYCGQ